MKQKLLLLFALSILLSSCDNTFVISGKIINTSSKEPIENAKVISAENYVTYTDKKGYFIIDRFGPGSLGDKSELLIEKPGYKTEYVDLSNYHSDLHNVLINLSTTNEIQKTYYNKSSVKDLYLFNLVFINLISLFTLLFIAIKKIRFKWLCILLILVVNVVLKVNYFNGEWELDFINTPFFLKNYRFYPFTIKIVFPISIIAFWFLYFYKRELFEKSKDDN